MYLGMVVTVLGCNGMYLGWIGKVLGGIWMYLGQFVRMLGGVFVDYRESGKMQQRNWMYLSKAATGLEWCQIVSWQLRGRAMLACTVS